MIQNQLTDRFLSIIFLLSILWFNIRYIKIFLISYKVKLILVPFFKTVCRNGAIIIKINKSNGNANSFPQTNGYRLLLITIIKVTCFETKWF